MTLTDKIYNYFDKNPELRVLFIFNDEFLALELAEATWKEGYRYVDFKGDWFTTKYNLDTVWADEKVILYFSQESPLRCKSLQGQFPLLDILTANMEFHHQDYVAYMQQYNLPPEMALFVEKNIGQLQSDRMVRLLQSYYADGSITPQIAVRAFLSSYLGQIRVLDWDSIILRILFLSRSTEQNKQTDFYVKLRSAPMVKEGLDEKLEAIFGCSINDNTEAKVKRVVETFKYNAIAQNLAPVAADNYKGFRITDSIALQQMNRILELAGSHPKRAEAMREVMDEWGRDIREEDLIRWYGTDANYYYIPEGLCLPILRSLMEKTITEYPKKAMARLEELKMKHGENSRVGAVIGYDMLVARYYESTLSLGSITLNRPDEYLNKYRDEYYLIDQLYRQSIEWFCRISPAIPLYDTVQRVKHDLDLRYARLCNRINQEWMRCLQEAGGMNAVHGLRQQDFYESLIKGIQKKVVVIVSDALRYEVAQELIGVLAARKHIARLDMGIAMLPSETKFCKPALLPHRSLRLYAGVEGTQNMGVDNRILDTMEKRTGQVDAYRQGAICVDYETVGRYEQERNREIFKHPLVYVMHDTIGQRSHSAGVKEIVDSCRDAINELETLVHKLHESYNVTEVYITSDHGFLFNDLAFEEKDKHKVSEDALEKSTRYYLTQSPAKVSGIVKFPLSEVSGMEADNIYVAVPEGTNRLQAPSGGYRFTHGGASLQELLIPVIVSHKKLEDTKTPVGVMVLDRNLSIQASRLRFRLLQTEAVTLNERSDEYQAHFANLGLSNVPISTQYVTSNPKLLSGNGVWCIVTIGYVTGEDVKIRWEIRTLKPVQISNVDVQEYIELRKSFTTEEWIDFMMHTVGLDPDRFNRREKFITLARLLPHVENNFNFMELGPKGTGKSHVFQELSPHGVLISGGDVTSARLFVRMSGNREILGLVGYWDVVAWDEFEQQKGRNVDAVLIDTMQNYLANKSFNRGKGTHEASASMVFVGNTKHTVPYMLKNSHLFESIPTSFIKGAFLDRIHLYNPGWEISTLKKESFSRGYGLITDYIAAIFHEMRNLDLTARVNEYARFDASLSERDHLAIRKTFSGMVKLLYPDGKMTDKEAFELVDFAAECRKRVKDQLYLIDETFRAEPAKFIYTRKVDGAEIQVETLEKLNYAQDKGQDAENPDAPQGNGNIVPEDSVETVKRNRPRIPVLQEKSLSFRLGQTGITYRFLFADYLKDAAEITIEDPFIRTGWQIRNLMEFMTMLTDTRNVDELKVHLITNEEEGKIPELIDKLDDIKDNMIEYGIEFDYKFRDFHDRCIRTDNGWVISLGRGLDIYEKYSPYSVAAVRQERRKCKEFRVTYLKSNPGNE